MLEADLRDSLNEKNVLKAKVEELNKQLEKEQERNQALTNQAR